MEQIRKFKKIVFGLVCAICIYSIFCVPVKATSIAEAVRSGQLKIDSNEFIVDKQLAAYAGLESYDSRKYYNTYVFNQEGTMTCWANSGLMALTISLDSNNQGRYIYSRRHAALTITGDLGEGGFPMMLLAYIASGKGPVLEIEMPWKSMNTDEEKNNNAKADETEKELLKTLEPTIKVDNWERLPCIKKELI